MSMKIWLMVLLLALGLAHGARLRGGSGEDGTCDRTADSNEYGGGIVSVPIAKTVFSCSRQGLRAQERVYRCRSARDADSVSHLHTR